jgi:DNA primase large subunit
MFFENMKSLISYSAVETALETQTLPEILMLGIQLTNEIVAEILYSHAELLEEVGLQDPSHKAVLVRKKLSFHL